MTRTQDAGGANPHVNYEPSILGGVSEAPNDITMRGASVDFIHEVPRVA